MRVKSGASCRTITFFQTAEDFPMFIAMNRFKVVKGEEEAFETVWSSRKTRLDEMKGFIAFHLLKGPEKEVPAGYIGQPEDLAVLAVWLASPLARYITGQVIHVDGGARRSSS